MSQTTASTSLRNPWPIARRFAPAILAIGLAWGGHSAFASSADGQTAINTKLDQFLTDFSTDPEPNATKGKAISTITAKSTDLVLAVAAVLEDPAFASVSTADVIAGVLIAGSGNPVVTDFGKKRADADKIIALLIAQAIKSRNIAGDGAAISAVIDAAIDAGTLKPAGLDALIGQSLKSATDPAAGAAIASAKVKAVISAQGTNATKFVATAVLNAATGTNANAGNIESFVHKLIDDGTLAGGADLAARTASAMALADLVAAKSKAAAGAAIAAAVPTGGSQADITTVATTALNDTKLQPAAAYITGNLLSKFKAAGGNVQTLATNLSVGKTDVTKAGIASGAIQADPANAATLFNSLKAGVVDITKFAAGAAVANSAASVKTITQEAANTAIDKTKLGAAIVTAISLTNPDAADGVGEALGGSSGDRPTLAAALAKAAKSGAAAGAVVTGVARTASTDLDREGIAIAANKAASKFIKNISMGVGSFFVDPFTTPQPSYRLADYAAVLTNANTAKASDIAVGASMANPILADQVVEKVVFLTGVNTGKEKASVAKIVQAVGTAVDVEEVAEIVTQVSTHYTLTGNAAGTISQDNALKSSTAPMIATAAAKAIQLKPGVKTSNRQDELGEAAASIVGEIIDGVNKGNLVLNADPTLANTALAKLISSVTGNIIKTLQKKEMVDNVSFNPKTGTGGQQVADIIAPGATLQADLTAAANIAGDVANTIKQALTLNLINATQFNAIQAQLLTDIPKLGGKGYANYTLNNVLTDGLITIAMKDGFNGTNNAANRYEDGTRTPTSAGYPTNPSTLQTTTRTGSVIDPETDTRPG